MGNGPWLINVKGDGVGATVEGKEEEMEGVTEAVLSMLGIGGDDIFLCDILLPESSRRAFHISMGFLPYERRLDNQSKGAKA
jgi:hypothetical protein